MQYMRTDAITTDSELKFRNTIFRPNFLSAKRFLGCKCNTEISFLQNENILKFIVIFIATWLKCVAICKYCYIKVT